MSSPPEESAPMLSETDGDEGHFVNERTIPFHEPPSENGLEEQDCESQREEDGAEDGDGDKEEEDDEADNKYPADSNSFLALDNPGFFAFGLMPFVFQCTLSLLMILSVNISKWRTVTNPPSNAQDTDAETGMDGDGNDENEEEDGDGDGKEDEEEEEDEANNKYPADSYSFLALYGPRDNPRCFAFGLMPFVFQCTLSLLMILSVTHPSFRTMEIDDKADNAGIFPSNNNLSLITQLVSITSYMIFADGTLLDISRAVELFPLSTADPKMQFSCVLRFVQGVSTYVAVLLLVLTETSVIGIVLNITAVNFISEFDNTAFALARSGKFGRKIKREAKRIENEKLPDSVEKEAFSFRYALVVSLLFSMTLALMAIVTGLFIKRTIWTITLSEDGAVSFVETINRRRL